MSPMTDLLLEALRIETNEEEVLGEEVEVEVEVVVEQDSGFGASCPMKRPPIRPLDKGSRQGF